MTIRDLQPKLIWEQFDDICQVPRPSKKEGKIIAWLIEFAKKHNIEYQTDETGNVVMRKPATKGFEDRPAVILQSHMDMVCEKNSNKEFDFENDLSRLGLTASGLRLRIQLSVPTAVSVWRQLLQYCWTRALSILLSRRSLP